MAPSPTAASSTASLDLGGASPFLATELNACDSQWCEGTCGPGTSMLSLSSASIPPRCHSPDESCSTNNNSASYLAWAVHGRKPHRRAVSATRKGAPRDKAYL